MKNILSLGLLLVAMSSLLPNSANAATATKSLEYMKLQRPSEAVGSLGNDLFGEQVDFYTGSTSFSATDISIPGNNDLPVALSRTLAISEFDGAHGGFWEIDVPKISGTFAATAGWVVSSSSPNSRCSSVGTDLAKAKPPLVSSDGAQFDAIEYWHGYHMSIPGQGSQELLVNHGRTPQPTNGTAYPWTTKGNWRIACIPTITGGVGEGFVAISPQGVKYTFNKMVSVVVSQLEKSKTCFNQATMETFKCPAYMSRIETSLLATSAEDRFGNTVTYSYNATGGLTSIVSSDGRQITLNRDGSGKLTSATDGSRTWLYGYTNGTIADTSPVFPLLTSVTQPDGQSWTYSYQGNLVLANAAGGEGPQGCDKTKGYNVYPATFQVLATHPSGAVGEFNFGNVKHELTNVTYQCGRAILTYFEPGTLYYPRLFWTFSLKSKKITGAGLPTAQWTYNYIPAKGGFAATGFTDVDDCTKHVCELNKKLEVTGPDNTIQRYQFGIEYRKTEGQLQKVETLSAGVTKKTEQLEYIVDADLPTQSFDGEAGLSPQPRANVFLSNYQRPQKRKVITQDGVNFESRIDTFDPHVTATKETKFSSLGDTTQNATAYEHNLNKWVIGQVKSVTNLDTTPGVEVSRNVYDAVTALPTQTYSFNQLKATYTYLPDGNLSTFKDALDRSVTLGNYYRGVPRTISFPDTTTISAAVNSTGSIASTTDQLGTLTQYTYDPMGRLASVTPPSGDTVAWTGATFTFAPNSVAAYGLPAGHWKQTINKGNYRKEIYFNAKWQPVVTREYDSSNVAATQKFTRMEYDTEGRATFASFPGDNDALTTGIRSEYDALGRITKTKLDSELGVLNTVTEYLTGFQTRVTNPRGFATTTSYQVFDTPDTSRPQIILAPEGVSTTILRNRFGKTLEVTRSGIWNGLPLSSTRKYVYDSEQRLCKRIEPETGATILDYDAVDNLAWTTQGSALTSTASCDRTNVAAADKTVRSYTNMNRLLATDVPGSLNDLAYDYFADGALKTLINGGSRWDYTYNKLRLPVTETLTLGSRISTLTHTYNAMAQESSLTYPSGLVIATTPNALGQASQVGSYASGISYFANGGMSGFVYGNGIVHSMTQNARMLPTRSKDMNGTTAILDDTYSFDENGNVASITDGTAGAGGNRVMTYDNADRLTRTNAPNQWWVNNYLTYDALDNIRVNTLGSRTHNYQYNATTQRLDQLTLPNASVARALAYDTSGNVTTNGTQAYVFDKANRMQSVNGLESYEYDGHGRRVKITRISDGKFSFPIYSLEGKLIAEEDERSNKTSDYIYLNGSLVAKRSAPIGSTTYITSYQHTDSLGSPIAESDAAKVVTRIERYTPYGEPTDQGYDQGPGFTGHVTDAATGLTYAQQRYYDPVIGRFLSADPDPSDMSTAWNFNRYNYAANNPYKYTDPDGRFIDTLMDAYDVVTNTGAMLGGAAAFAVGKATGDEGLANAAIEGIREGRADMGFAAAAVLVPGANSAALKAGAKLVDKASDAKRAANGVSAAKAAPMPCKSSFDDDTLVVTDNGFVRIIDIKFGDKVLAKNEITNLESYQLVAATMNQWHATTQTITLQSINRTESIVTTDEHPFFVVGKGFVPAIELKEGDEIQLAAGGVAVLVTSKTNEMGQFAYNLTVDNDHTYFVGESQAWVHNACRVGDFSRSAKTDIKNTNARANGGAMKCTSCKNTAVPAKQSQRGVTPPKNEATVDHKQALADGGTGDKANGQVLCRGCHDAKTASENAARRDNK